jgi:DNA polymerase III sliding clamp (beta) subunit (PCNA family)
MTTVLPKNASKAAQAVYKTVHRKDTLPILTHIHLYTDNGWLIAESTNLETASRENIPARVENDIDICIPARTWKDWLAVVAKNYQCVIGLRYDPSVMILTAELVADGIKSRTTFKGMDSMEFPSIDNLLTATA